MKQHDGHMSSTFLHVPSVDKGEEGSIVAFLKAPYQDLLQPRGGDGKGNAVLRACYEWQQHCL